MKRLGVILLLIAVSALIVFGAGKIQSMSPRHNFELGKKAYKNEEYEKAIAYFSRVIQLDSRFPHIYGWRAFCYRFLGEDDRALADINEDIRLNPNMVALYGERASLYYVTGDYDRAIADYTKVIELKYNVEFSYLRRAEAYLQKDDYDCALADFDKVLQLDPKKVGALVGKGQVHRKKKEYGHAEANFLKAVQQAPESPRGYSNLAWLWATCTDPKFRNGVRAVEYATKANELTSWEDPYYLDTLAAAHAEVGNFDEAVKWIKKALEHQETYHPEDLTKAHEALKLYEARKPYREE